jgi:hypothetical protein
MIAASGASEEELAAITAALSLLLCHPERSGEAAESRERDSPWLEAARREAVGLD